MQQESETQATASARRNWPTDAETRERDERRGKVVASALMAGTDPVEALVDHDRGLAHLPTAERSKHRLNTPSFPERVQGAKSDVVATHRFANTLERVEVRTTLDYLLKYADDKGLGQKVLDGCNKILTEFLNNPLPNVDEVAVRVRIKEFEAAAKLMMRFYDSSRQFMVKREANETAGETTINPGDRDAIAQKLTLLNQRAAQIANLLSSEAEVQSDAPEVCDETTDETSEVCPGETVIEIEDVPEGEA